MIDHNMISTKHWITDLENNLKQACYDTAKRNGLKPPQADVCEAKPDGFSTFRCHECPFAPDDQVSQHDW